MEPWKLGPVTVYPFGLILAAACLAALLWTAARMRRAGLRAGTAGWFAMLAVPMGFVLARLGYCLMIVDQLMGDEDFGFLFRVTEGGFILWGGIAGGLLAAWLTGRITGQDGAAVADAAAVPACLVIAAGRIAAGLIFRDQGTGFELAEWFSPEETDFAARFSLLPLEDWRFFERLPFAVRNFYDEWCWAIFVPEALWAAVTGVIVHRTKARPGGKAALFLLLYACGQIALEAMLRGEVLHLPWLGFVRANQILCAVALLALWGRFTAALPRGGRLRPALTALAQLLLAVGVVVAMEFAAFEKKISLIEWLPADACHLIMILACLWMALALLSLWRRKYRTE